MDIKKVSFMEAVQLFFKNYVNFHGRSRRSEYWWATLFLNLVAMLFAFISPEISGLWSLVVLVPTIALSIRRMHDIGKSGWWLLISLVPLVGAVLLLIWSCRDSDPQPNQWGPSPKY